MHRKKVALVEVKTYSDFNLTNLMNHSVRNPPKFVDILPGAVSETYYDNICISGGQLSNPKSVSQDLNDGSGIRQVAVSSNLEDLFKNKKWIERGKNNEIVAANYFLSDGTWVKKVVTDWRLKSTVFNESDLKEYQTGRWRISGTKLMLIDYKDLDNGFWVFSNNTFYESYSIFDDKPSKNKVTVEGPTQLSKEEMSLNQYYWGNSYFLYGDNLYSKVEKFQELIRFIQVREDIKKKVTTINEDMIDCSTGLFYSGKVTLDGVGYTNSQKSEPRWTKNLSTLKARETTSDGFLDRYKKTKCAENALPVNQGLKLSLSVLRKHGDSEVAKYNSDFKKSVQAKNSLDIAESHKFAIIFSCNNPDDSRELMHRYITVQRGELPYTYYSGYVVDRKQNCRVLNINANSNKTSYIKNKSLFGADRAGRKYYLTSGDDNSKDVIGMVKEP